MCVEVGKMRDRWVDFREVSDSDRTIDTQAVGFDEDLSFLAT